VRNAILSGPITSEAVMISKYFRQTSSIWQGQRFIFQVTLSDKFSNLFYGQISDNLNPASASTVSIGRFKTEYVPY